MPRYEQTVIETRTYKVRYVVEAENEEEATNNVAIGLTEEEQELGSCEVLDRTAYGDIKKIEE